VSANEQNGRLHRNRFDGDVGRSKHEQKQKQLAPTSTDHAGHRHNKYRGRIAKLVVIGMRAALHRRQALGRIISDYVCNKIQAVGCRPALDTRRTLFKREWE